MSDSHQKSLRDEILFLTEKLSSIRVERANLRADSDEMTALMNRTNDDVVKSFSNVSTEVQKGHEDTVEAVKQKLSSGPRGRVEKDRTSLSV